MQKHCRDHGKRPVCRSELSASSFNFFSKPLVLTLPPPRPSLGWDRSSCFWSWTCAWDQGEEAACHHRRGAAATAAQSEGETSSRKACGSRKADRGTQETWGRNGASTCLLECENASSKVALSHTVFWERERKRLAEAFISGLSVVQWEALWKALGIELKEKILSQKCAANEERSRKNVRGAGRLAVVTLKDQLLVMTRLRIRLGWLHWAGAGIHFWCVGGWCVTHLSRSGLVSCTWGWDDFRRGHLGRMWRHPWQSVSMRSTLTRLMSLMPQSCAPKFMSGLAVAALFFLQEPHNAEGLDWYFPEWLDLLCQWVVEWVHQWSRAGDQEHHVLSSHSPAVLPFNFFFFFFFFTFWLRSSVAWWFAWLLHKHHVLSFKNKKNYNHRIHKHCSLSIPLFF